MVNTVWESFYTHTKQREGGGEEDEEKNSGKMLQLGFMLNPEIYVELHLESHRYYLFRMHMYFH